jgi:hypothetical protein
MKAKFLIPVIVTPLLVSACVSPGSSVNRLDFFGSPAPASAATRTIAITPETRHVNVIGGEIVNFAVGNKSFIWNFNGAQHVPPFDLTRAAPPGLLDHKVTAYIQPNPLYRGEGDPESTGTSGR